MPDISRLLETLNARGFQSAYFDTGAAAVDYLDRTLDRRTIGFGGSTTLQALSLYERLSTHNHVLWHWKREEDRRPAFSAPVFLTSANALAETGELVNIDAGGNRVAATCFGPELLIFVIGLNKLVPDLESAICRARNVAAPQNCGRLNRKTPCSQMQQGCFDCSSADRLCKVMSVHFGRPLNIPMAQVLLINENLGY